MSDIERRIVEYIPRLRRYAHSLFPKGNGAADDLVQDCLERALSKSHQWQEGTNLRAWLFTIMHNIYVNQIRRINNGPSFEELPETIDQSIADTSVIKMELRDLQVAISKLPPDQREILLLVTLEGLQYQQIANIIGIPEGTVMSKLSRSRQQLRKLMQRDNIPRLRRIK